MHRQSWKVVGWWWKDFQSRTGTLQERHRGAASNLTDHRNFDRARCRKLPHFIFKHKHERCNRKRWRLLLCSYSRTRVRLLKPEEHWIPVMSTITKTKPTKASQKRGKDIMS